MGFSPSAGAGGPLKAPKAVVRTEVPSPRESRDTLRMLFIGDMMMHTRQLGYDSRAFIRELEPLIAEADVAVAGAEFTLAGKPYMGYPRFSAPDEYPGNIRASGIDVLLLANNHILDHGSAGLSRTLEKIGEPYCGAGADSASFARHNPLIIRAGGVSVALVNFTYGTNLGADREWPKVARMEDREVSALMERARKADFVVALPHWGEEYVLRHNASQERWAARLAELGADVIIGAHPHVVQDTATVKGVPVVYSMGNAVSNMSAPNTRLELAVTLRVVSSAPAGVVELLGPELHFLWCTLPGKLTDGFSTIPVAGYLGKRYLWKDPSDYDNMVRTLERVHKETRIEHQ